MRELKNYMIQKKFKAYNHEAKQEFKKIGRKFCIQLIRQCEPAKSHYNYNAAGIACSGDHSVCFEFPKNKFLYIMFNADMFSHMGILYRTMQDIKDFCGNDNNYCSWSESDKLSDKIKLLIEREY